jgi:hypothetical protein
MFIEAGNIRIFLDTESRKLRVQTNQMPARLKPHWIETDSFADPESWIKSHYFTQVTDQDLQDFINWFWIDIDAPPCRS